MKGGNLLLIFLTALFFTSLPLCAQQSGGGRYVIEQRYVQQLVWIGDQYTLKYEVVIERNEGKGYRSYMREFTELPTIQISVPPGSYRYRIIPYDYLEQPGEASAWVNIDIKPAPIAAVDGQTANDDDSILPSDNKSINFYISAEWSPISPIYGRTQEVFGYEFSAVGAGLRFGLLFNKFEWFIPGLELSTSWYALNKDQSKDKLGMLSGGTGFNVVAKKHLPNQSMAFTIKAGGAIVFQIGEINTGDYEYTTGGIVPQLNLETSFLWFVLKQLYLEIGVGLNHFITKDDNSGCLRPCLGVGWQF